MLTDVALATDCVIALIQRHCGRPLFAVTKKGSAGDPGLGSFQKCLKNKEIVVGTTGAKVKNKINDLYTLTGYSGALIANGNFQRRPPHPRVSLQGSCQAACAAAVQVAADTLRR